MKTCPSPKSVINRRRAVRLQYVFQTFEKLKKYMYLEWARPDDVLIHVKDLLGNLKSKRLQFVLKTETERGKAVKNT